MVRHWDNDAEEAGDVEGLADEDFHVAAALLGWECGGEGGADGGFGGVGEVVGGDPGF